MEFLSFSNIVYAVFFIVVPIIMVFVSLSKPRGLHYMTATLIFFVLNAVMAHEAMLVGVYLLGYFVFLVFWIIKGGREYERSGHNFNIYRQMYASYYNDDLNNDGIIDAFDNWKMAHDPRFSWIFASRKVRHQRKAERLYKEFTGRTDFDYSTYEGNKKVQNDNARFASKNTNAGYSRQKTGYQRTYYSSVDKQYDDTSRVTKDEAAKKIEAQHAFARRNDLRYFSMCTSKEEGKKLYRKYAAKYHPDNPMTGNKEKFISIDEEYNRFEKINDWDFVSSV